MPLWYNNILRLQLNRQRYEKGVLLVKDILDENAEMLELDGDILDENAEMLEQDGDFLDENAEMLELDGDF